MLCISLPIPIIVNNFNKFYEKSKIEEEIELKKTQSLWEEERKGKCWVIQILMSFVTHNQFSKIFLRVKVINFVGYCRMQNAKFEKFYNLHHSIHSDDDINIMMNLWLNQDFTGSPVIENSQNCWKENQLKEGCSVDWILSTYFIPKSNNF